MTISMIETNFNESGSNNRAHKYQYQNTIRILSNLLDDCNNASSKEEEIIITEQIFQHLIDNQNILMYEPRFRNLTINKLNEIERHLNERKREYTAANYCKAMALLNYSVRGHIKHSEHRAKLYNNMRNMVNVFKNYENWVEASSLRNTMSTLRYILNNIEAQGN